VAKPKPVQHFHKKVAIRLAALDRSFTWLCREVGFTPQAYHSMKSRQFPELQRLSMLTSVLGLSSLDYWFRPDLGDYLFENYEEGLRHEANTKDRIRVRMAAIDLSVQRLSDLISLPQRSVSQWLRSPHEANDEKLVPVTAQLGLPVEILRDAIGYPAALLEGWREDEGSAETDNGES